jgi:hypothetical protein
MTSGAETKRLRGDERFSFGPTVLDFWRWALGDLRMNTVRGFLAEFFVAEAVEASAPIRVEWGDYDVEAKDGTRIEVKAAGYLQSWRQKRISTPSWSFSSAYSESAWDESKGTYVEVDPRDRVHVWVFALQTCTEPEQYDPLDLDQWQFRVIAHCRLFETGQRSARLSFFDRLGIEPVSFNELGSAISAARSEHEGGG